MCVCLGGGGGGGGRGEGGYVIIFQTFCIKNCFYTLADDNPDIEQDVRQGGLTPTEVNPKLYHDVQTALSRLVGKTTQLIGNCTTNLAECWMHIGTKFDGGQGHQQIPKWLMGT